MEPLDASLAERVKIVEARRNGNLELGTVSMQGLRFFHKLDASLLYSDRFGTLKMHQLLSSCLGSLSSFEHFLDTANCADLNRI